MPLRKPDDFLKEGSKVFRRAPVDTDAIKGWAAIARDKAADALRSENSNSTRLGASYDTVFNLSLAVLCSKGWRTTAADGHHKEGLEAACAFSAVPVHVFDDIDAVREVRNHQYGGIAPSPEDVAFGIKSMERVVPKLLRTLEPWLARSD